MNLIALVGFAGSGKNAVADRLIDEYYFQKLAFADCLKDAVAAIFDWPRHLLEGDTKESRAFREKVDAWWADELGIPAFTPRYALQQFGTEVIRKGFHNDIWLLTVKRRIASIAEQNEGANIVITDMRFPNEMQLVRELGGVIVRVKRGADPEWAPMAAHFNDMVTEARKVGATVAEDEWDQKFPEGHEARTIHASERAWLSNSYDDVIENDGTLEELHTLSEVTVDKFFG